MLLLTVSFVFFCFTENVFLLYTVGTLQMLCYRVYDLQ